MDSFLTTVHDHCWLMGYAASSFSKMQGTIIVHLH
jgi:hypothetical protein